MVKAERVTKLKNKLNNKGFSLLEMIIAAAIATLVISGMGAFLISGVRNYQSSRERTNLQIESQTALNLMTDLIMEGKQTTCQTGTSVINGVTAGVFYNGDTVLFCYVPGEAVTNAGSGGVYLLEGYTDIPVEIESTVITAQNLIAEHVTNCTFEKDMDTITITLCLSQGGKTLSTTAQAYPRNR